MTQNESNHSSREHIFRSEAIQNYMQRREETIFPRLASPSVIMYLWGLLGLLFVMTAASWLIKIPVHTPAFAVFANRKEVVPRTGKTQAEFIILLPPETPVKPGQTVWLGKGNTNEQFKGQIIDIEPKLRKPIEALAGYGIEREVASFSDQPMIMATATFYELPASSFGLTELEPWYRVNVEIGERRVISSLFWTRNQQ